MSVAIAYCTCPDVPTAARLGRALLEEALAACVQTLPGITSIYRWQGELREDNEVLLLIKTTRARVVALKARVAELHPYDMPELIAVDVADGLAPYLDWVEAGTRAQ